MRKRKTFEKTVDALLLIARTTRDATDLAPFPYLRVAVGALVVLLETIKGVKSNKGGCLALAQDASELVETIKHEVTIAPLQVDSALEKVVEDFVSRLNEIIASLQALIDRSYFKRFLMEVSDAEVITESRQKLEHSFRSFMTATQIQIRAEQQRSQEEHRRAQEEQRRAQEEQKRLLHVQLLAGLQVVPARWTDVKKCYEGTRIALLEEIRRWGRSEDQSANPLYWLSDVAGSGKSTIANHMASEWRTSNQLAGCFFFSRDSAEKKDLKNFCGTVASDLAEWFPELRSAICENIEKSPSIASRPFQEQFDSLISDPLSKNARTLILVIDALDECDPEDRALLLDALTAKGWPRMKIFLTSRPEQDITDKLRTAGQRRSQFDLGGESNKADISRYVESQLSSLRSPRRPVVWLGPTAEEVATIAERADGLFIWASTTCKMIKGSVNPKDLLCHVIKDASLANLDKLYLEALNTAVPPSDRFEREAVASILSVIATALEPLSIDALDELLEVDYVEDVVKRLGSVLSFGESRTAPVRILHPTFLEFLTSAERCADPSIRVDPAKAHGRLSEGCFHKLRILRRDICNIGDPSLLNSEIENLEEKINHSIPESLRYACRFWSHHAVGSDNSIHQQSLILEVLKPHFLHWLEALSLMGRSHEGAWALRQLKAHMKYEQCSNDDLRVFYQEALRFIQVHQYVIQVSALHVYISALAFTPRSISIPHHDSSFTTFMPMVVTGQGIAWSAPVTLKQGSCGGVSCVTLSPDGTWVACGTYDGFIHTWDAISGSTKRAAFQGPKNEIHSIAFSPDGHQIATGSTDNVVHLWNVMSGSVIGSPLVGHNGAIRCVSFSSNGSRIASGSDDKTLRIWDVSKNSLLLGPLEGYAESVVCVEFFQHGARLVSASADHAVRIWDLATGSAIFVVSETQPKLACYIKFSPGGTRMASVSSNKIRVRDVPLDPSTVRALGGHKTSEDGSTHSPDEKHFQSDTTALSIWSKDSDSVLDGILSGYIDTVSYIAVSQDGSQVAYSPQAYTICIWNAASDAAADVVAGHPGGVYHIQFSHDGSKVASCSHESAIRIWDVKSGSMIGGPLEQLGGPIRDVRFSDDGITLAAEVGWEKTEYHYQWELRDSVWNPVTPSTTWQGHSNSPMMEPKLEMDWEGWVYQVGTPKRRLFYLPRANWSGFVELRFGDDDRRFEPHCIWGGLLATASQRGQITIIDCTSLLT